MVMSVVESLALIVLIVSAIKLLVLIVHPKSWMRFASKLWSAPKIVSGVSFVLALVVLYYLIQEINIIQIFAVILFVALISAASISGYARELVHVMQGLARRPGFFKRFWFPIVIWVILVVWGFVALF